ncbi:hypothetical protein SLEP1_g40273 [Rubroshorea leprosula]|uniref:Uncharacterized protein n=1 Tax=Rubroshorea leprosula TaxID=152421 RepID=A0AAV5L332_9ROSI|nr:hypothetical protein SLEP1_g40273 [Rubroshorea leprosula]
MQEDGAVFGIGQFQVGSGMMGGIEVVCEEGGSRRRRKDRSGGGLPGGGGPWITEEASSFSDLGKLLLQVEGGWIRHGCLPVCCS